MLLPSALLTLGVCAQIMAETYQPMPSYRLATSDGVLQLTEGLAARLAEILEARVREEQR